MNDIESISMKGSGVSKMPHSHSTPAGVDGGSRTPPTTPRKAGKMLAVRVQMLDDTVTMFQVQVTFSLHSSEQKIPLADIDQFTSAILQTGTLSFLCNNIYTM